MIKSLFFKQKKPLTIMVLGSSLFVLGLYYLSANVTPLAQSIGMLVLAMLLLGYSVSYEISTDFRNKRHLQMFGVSVFKSKLDIAFPDYMIVFSAKFKQGSEWGSVAAIGKERSSDGWVIRLFKGNAHFTVYRAKSFSDATNKATELSELLGVGLLGGK